MGVALGVTRRHSLTAAFQTLWLLLIFLPPLPQCSPRLRCRSPADVSIEAGLHSTTFWLAVAFCSGLNLLQREVASMRYLHQVSPARLPKCELSKRRVKLEREKSMRSQPYTKTYRQLKKTGDGRSRLPKERNSTPAGLPGPNSQPWKHTYKRHYMNQEGYT